MGEPETIVVRREVYRIDQGVGLIWVACKAAILSFYVVKCMQCIGYRAKTTFCQQLSALFC